MSTEPDNSNFLQQEDDSDWFLQYLVGTVTNSTTSFGITLQVSGMLVSGNLICGNSYFEGFASDFAGGISDSEVAASIKEILLSFRNDYSTNEDDDVLPPARFIHLKDARFFNTSGNPIPGNRGLWWRGRISEVGGFSPGSLQPEQT